MRGTGRVLLMCVALLLAAGATGSHAANIDLTVATKYQTVDGFGSHTNITAWQIRQGPFYVTVDLGAVGFYDSLARDMQLIRMWIPTMQASAGAAYDQADFTHEIQLHNRGITRFFGSCWSPPAWMKDNGAVANGGALLPQYYGAYARMCAEYARQFKQKVGIDLYGLSLQNEPVFAEPYNSCVYSSTTYRDLLKVAGPIMDSVSPATKIIAAEDVLPSPTRSNGFIQAIEADAVAKPFLDVYAVHCHTEIFENSNDAYRGWWTTVRTVGDANNLPLWMTETGDGFDTTWVTAVKLACTIANSFKYGNVTSWVWWTLASSNENSMVLNGVYTPKYYQMAHFGRFVKLGARRIESQCVDTELREAAFQNIDGTVVVVVANRTGTARSVTLAGAGLPVQFQAFQSTSPTSMMRNVGSVTTGNALALPAYSITTFTSGTTGVAGRSAPRSESVRPAMLCRQSADNAGVSVDLTAPGRVSLVVYSSQGRVVGRSGPVMCNAQTTLGWKAVTAGVYVARVKVETTGGTVLEQAFQLRTR
jgi:O-glycosyl hydrolase